MSKVCQHHVVGVNQLLSLLTTKKAECCEIVADVGRYTGNTLADGAPLIFYAYIPTVFFKRNECLLDLYCRAFSIGCRF